MSRRELAGAVVAVTGGARGIGAAIGRALSAAGARVVLGDLDGSAAARAEESWGAEGRHLDVTSATSFASFLDEVQARHGRLDGLINNAGIMVIGPLEQTPVDRQLAQLEVNLRGVVLGSQLAAPLLAASGGGQIVNIASLAGRIPTPGSAVYSATKAGVIALSEALDAELAGAGVRVAAVLPAFTATRMIAGTTAPRLSRPVTPDQVAARVLAVMRRHRAVSVVPRRLGPAAAMWSLLPARVRAQVRRSAGLDRMFLDVDAPARAEYDAATGG